MRIRSVASIPLLAALAAGLLLAVLLPAQAAAKTSCWLRVLNDWTAHGNVTGTYPIHCYQEALRNLPEDVRDYSSAADDIFAALQRNTLGPVVIVALPGAQIRNPITNQIQQSTYVLQAPRGPDPFRNDASISVPFDTILAFAAGATVKLQNASIFAQNQGSALQTSNTREVASHKHIAPADDYGSHE